MAEEEAGATEAEQSTEEQGAEEAQASEEVEQEESGETSEEKSEDESEEGSDDEEGEKPGPIDIEALTIPEGMQVDETAAASFQEIAEKHGISQEAAQDLIDFQAGLLEGNADALNTRLQEMHADALIEQSEKWRSQAEESFGDKFDDVAAKAASAYERFEDIDGIQALMMPFDPEKNPDGLGLGNHPVMIAVFDRIEGLIANDSFPTSGKGAQKSQAETLYPDMEK